MLGGVVQAAAQAIRGDSGGVEASIKRLLETDPEGISHNAAEYTAPVDLSAGANALPHMLLELAAQEAP